MEPMITPARIRVTWASLPDAGQEVCHGQAREPKINAESWMDRKAGIDYAHSSAKSSPRGDAQDIGLDQRISAALKTAPAVARAVPTITARRTREFEFPNDGVVAW